MFPLTFGPTQHISRCSFFLSSVRVILPPRHFSLPFFFSTSVPPHLFSPLISLGYWPCLSLLIQCSIGRSIERLSVPPQYPPSSSLQSPSYPHPNLPMSPQMTADTHPPGKLAFYIPYWRASPPPSPFRITFHLHSPRTWER